MDRQFLREIRGVRDPVKCRRTRWGQLPCSRAVREGCSHVDSLAASVLPFRCLLSHLRVAGKVTLRDGRAETGRVRSTSSIAGVGTCGSAPSCAMTTRYLRALVVIVAAALIVLGIAPYDRTTWWLEIFPVLIGFPVLVVTARRFPLTRLTYTLLAVHAIILIVGGHYTYARVPLGFWLQDLLGLTRNDYDRIGHFVQGFVPAILVREILLRTSPLRPGRWLFVLVTATCLAFSACYEFFEWWSALAGGHAADAFLGTQGDVWDTQWDMFSALLGALSAQLLLGRIHDRSLAKLILEV